MSRNPFAVSDPVVLWYCWTCAKTPHTEDCLAICLSCAPVPLKVAGRAPLTGLWFDDRKWHAGHDIRTVVNP